MIQLARQEDRKKHCGIYYELHHIVPEFMFKNRRRTGPKGHLEGNPESKDNKILLTFKEHLLAHYYLYEIYKGTRYEYSAGSALQFFFTKAGNNHIRQVELSKVDENFLEEMEYLRKIGIDSISQARKGKMPVVDAVTREKIGSVPVDHPRVKSGEWVHHSSGKKITESARSNKKSQHKENNNNYKPLTAELESKIFECITRAIEDDMLVRNVFVKNIKESITEFKKISHVWINNRYGSIQNLVDLYNKKFDTNIKFNPYYRSKAQRSALRDRSSIYMWVTNGETNLRIFKSEEIPNGFKKGRIL